MQPVSNTYNNLTNHYIFLIFLLINISLPGRQVTATGNVLICFKPRIYRQEDGGYNALNKVFSHHEKRRIAKRAESGHSP